MVDKLKDVVALPKQKESWKGTSTYQRLQAWRGEGWNLVREYVRLLESVCTVCSERNSDGINQHDPLDEQLATLEYALFRDHSQCGATGG